jgi:hypothetical protein
MVVPKRDLQELFVDVITGSSTTLQRGFQENASNHMAARRHQSSLVELPYEVSIQITGHLTAT